MTAPVIVKNEVAPTGGVELAGQVDRLARLRVGEPPRGGHGRCAWRCRLPVPVAPTTAGARVGQCRRRTRWTTRCRPLDRRWHEFSPCPVGKRRDRNFVFGRDRPRTCAQHAQSNGAQQWVRSSVASMQMPAPQCCFANHRPPGGFRCLGWHHENTICGEVLAGGARRRTRSGPVTNTSGVQGIAAVCIAVSRTGSGREVRVRSSLAFQAHMTAGSIRIERAPHGPVLSTSRSAARAGPDPAPTVMAPGCCLPRSRPRRSRLIRVAAGSSEPTDEALAPHIGFNCDTERKGFALFGWKGRVLGQDHQRRVLDA